MLTRTTVLRVLFLFTAFLMHGQPSYAQYPSFQTDCNSYCSGERYIHECEFYDSGNGTVNDAGSVCDLVGECIYGGLTCFYPGQTEIAGAHFDAWCGTAALGAGDYNPWFVMGGCIGYDGTAEGSFYCSYTDVATCY